MKKLIAVVAMLATCGGSDLSNECNPCPMDHAHADGNTVTCSCAIGSGSQSYQRTLQTTTFCADATSAWETFALTACQPPRG